MAAFTIVAFISKGLDKEQYYKARAAEHDCAAHAQKQNGNGFKDPLKASKQSAKGR
jgi:hypothetical protein